MPARADKKPKDKNAPKRALSAYMLFGQDARPKIVAENKDLKITEVSKVISEQWKALSESDKKAYQDKADKLKESYQKELAKYKKSDNFKKYQKQLSDWKNEQKEGKKEKKSPKKAAKKAKSPKKKAAKKAKKSPKKSPKAE